MPHTKPTSKRFFQRQSALVLFVVISLLLVPVGSVYADESAGIKRVRIIRNQGEYLTL